MISFPVYFVFSFFPLSSSSFVVLTPSFSPQNKNVCNTVVCKRMKIWYDERIRTETTRYASSFGTTVTNNSPVELLHRCRVLGDLFRIRITDDDDSFLGAMAVPTFGSTTARDKETHSSKSLRNEILKTSASPKARGLEGVFYPLDHSPAFVLNDVLSKEACEEIIATCEMLGFNSYQAGRNNHGAMQILVPQEVVDCISQSISPHVDINDVEERRKEMLRAEGYQEEGDEYDVRLVYAGLNRRWRIYRYEPNKEETFSPHIDAGFPPSGLSEDHKYLVWDITEKENIPSPGLDQKEEEEEEEIVSRLTVLFYLNDDFEGGETNFLEPVIKQQQTRTDPPKKIASIQPVAGSCLIFPQAVGEKAVEYARQYWPLHEGSPVLSSSSSSSIATMRSRPKYVIRSDILFATTREKLPIHDKLWRYDHLVRDTFLPTTSAVYNKQYLNHLASLYNPHMGVENMGPLLYSLIRFTKCRNIVEIGAGYTSLWILQALKDNDLEMSNIHELQRSGKCKLLNYPWTIPNIVEEYNIMLDDNENNSIIDSSSSTTFASSSSSLLCIDNCEHQKETATGALAIAKALGLNSYMKFIKGDAFELQKSNIIDKESVDMIWCDFGVGPRIHEFVGDAWLCIRPGGFLLCHSTITNQRTRAWVEALRERKPKEITGLDPKEYVELSLLEPHKRYQNSVTILQKRVGNKNDGNSERSSYKEPLYSEYA